MKKFLIANPFGIGDVLFTLASVEKIRETYPDALVGFICNERTEELLALCPAVDKLYAFNRDALRAAWKRSPFSYFREIKKLTRAVAREKYEVLLDFSLGREFSLAACFLGIRQRIGFDYKNRGIFLTQKKKIRSYESIPVAQEQLNLLREVNLLPDNRMPSSIRISIPEILQNFKADKGLLAVAPGGGRSWGKDAIYKQWDAEKFTEAVNCLLKARPDTQVVLLGDSQEKALLESVKAGIKITDCRLVAGETLGKVCAILKHANLLLCNDGGLMHLAHALGVRTVSVFGPVDEKVYGPYGGVTPHRVITQNVECRPCYQNFHFPPCPHSRRCLTKILPHKVVEAVKEIL